MDPNAWSISSDVDNPELILSLIDYMYSEDGYYLINYGEENVSYTLNENGEPEYTDLILNNPDHEYREAAYLYASSEKTRLPFVSDYSRCFVDYTDAEYAALEVFSNDCDHSMDYPPGAVMSTEDKDIYYIMKLQLILTLISLNMFLNLSVEMKA